MPRGKSGFGFASQLSKMVNKLKEQRRKHADALRSLDEIFEKIGIKTHLAEEERPKRGRPPGKRKSVRPPNAKSAGSVVKKRRKGRVQFSTTGPESIMAFVKKAGAKGVMGGEIGKHWKTEGRGAGVYVVIGDLVKAKKLKREYVKGERGCREAP